MAGHRFWFTPGAALVGLVIHMVTGALFGIGLAFVARAVPRRLLVAFGTLYGLGGVNQNRCPAIACCTAGHAGDGTGEVGAIDAGVRGSGHLVLLGVAPGLCCGPATPEPAPAHLDFHRSRGARTRGIGWKDSHPPAGSRGVTKPRIRMRAVLNGVVVAESEDTVVVEGKHYFQPDSVNTGLVSDSTTRTLCPWKGVANYPTTRTSPCTASRPATLRGSTRDRRRSPDASKVGWPSGMVWSWNRPIPHGVNERRWCG
jgi:hypothetical protein